MRYRAADVYAFLILRGCWRDADRYSTGEGWVTPDSHVFVLPTPDLFEGTAWLDAEVLDENLRDCWTGLPVPLPLKRHP